MWLCTVEGWNWAEAPWDFFVAFGALFIMMSRLYVAAERGKLGEWRRILFPFFDVSFVRVNYRVGAAVYALLGIMFVILAIASLLARLADVFFS